MQINSITNKVFSNKTVLKGLEKISEHATSFAAGASLLMSLGVRTYSIYKTPDVEKENRFYAMANSITSGIVKFGIVEAIALPIENAVSKIDKNASKYLKDSTLKNFNPQTRSYKFITQIIKLSTGLITAIPKSMLTIALIPVVMDKVFKYNPLNDLKKAANEFHNKSEALKFFAGVKRFNFETEPVFTGRVGDKIAAGIGKIIENKKVQKLAQKYEMEDEDIYKHITAMTDVLLTSASVWQTNKSQSIKENCKRVLNYNNIIEDDLIALPETNYCNYKLSGQLGGTMDKYIIRKNFDNVNYSDELKNTYGDCFDNNSILKHKYGKNNNNSNNVDNYLSGNNFENIDYNLMKQYENNNYENNNDIPNNN